MNLPFFYIDQYNDGQQTIVLNEDSSRHIIQVLRMKTGEQLNLTDGKGHLLTAVIVEEHKKHCTVKVEASVYKEPSPKKVSIAISLLKNTSRFEWFLEKATEIGVAHIIPLICERTEKEKFRADRLQGILVSAMLQSQQVWLPVLHNPADYKDVFLVKEAKEASAKFIAHCEDAYNKQYISSSSSSIILIGPEGDFTPKEIEQALQNDFKPVTLGDTRLRTETAGMVAATLLVIDNA
ncbi:MAG TPA: RsmE family RNA methyltransferase [Chitinophagaceae bacterium]|jgi:16S rRNA (uracil1498-N3)-methyltransferase|nr:RsmE family RNA methyltransferase [Chitinophagaceae bacterium]